MKTILAVNKIMSRKILSNWNVQTQHLLPVGINDEPLVGFSKVSAWAGMTIWHKEGKDGVFRGSGTCVTEPNQEQVRDSPGKFCLKNLSQYLVSGPALGAIPVPVRHLALVGFHQ